MFAFWSSYGTIKGGKFWKRSFNVKFNSPRFSLKQILRSSEKFHFVNNWFRFNAGNLFFSVFFFSKKIIYRTKVAFKRIFDKTCIQVFLKSTIFLSQQFTQMKTFQIWNITIFFEYHLKLLEAVCSCFSKSLIKMKKLTWIYIFTLVIGPSKSFMEAITPIIKLVETPQWSLKIKNEVNFFFPSRIGVGRVKYSSF